MSALIWLGLLACVDAPENASEPLPLGPPGPGGPRVVASSAAQSAADRGWAESLAQEVLRDENIECPEGQLPVPGGP